MPPPKPLTTAEQAAFHIVRRVQSDANFAWLMMGTESLALCMRAVVESRGESEESIRELVDKNAASLKRTPEVVQLRKRVEELEACLPDDAEPDFKPAIDDSQFQCLSAVEELLRFAELGVEKLTVESLRHALDGNALAAYRRGQ